MLTVYGIETLKAPVLVYSRLLYVATVLTAYGIETNPTKTFSDNIHTVATVLTVYGIETDRLVLQPYRLLLVGWNSTYRLRY